jgi:hypothetical protein
VVTRRHDAPGDDGRTRDQTCSQGGLGVVGVTQGDDGSAKLGHANPRIIARVYSHSLGEGHRCAVASIIDRIGYLV